MSEVTTPAPLEPLNEDWHRALAVVAHPDDLEFGAAAAIARWTGQGKHIAYSLLTSGEAGIDGLPPDRSGPLREQEQRASAAAVGVHEVDFEGFPDGVLEYGLPLRRTVARAVRRHRPDVVITSNVRDTWDDATALNQADHIAAGRAVLDGARDAGNRWVFTELLDAGLEPWGGVREIWAANSPRARHAVDVTGTFDRGLASLQAHEQYLAGLGSGNFDPEEFLTSLCRQSGTRLSVRYAVAFEVFPLQRF
jgi:LmbE family N-acetylglucosaminyl deacetylase